MPLEIKATARLDELLDRFEMLGAGIFPNTARAVDVSAGLVLRTWVNIAQGNDLSGKPENVSFKGSFEYASSIRIQSLGALRKLVFSDSKIGEGLEKGRKKYDMKPALVKGPKSRLAKDGTRYNIVPFRHKIDELKQIKIGDTSAYVQAKQLVKQTVIGFRIDGEGKRRLTYGAWTKEKRLETSHKQLAGLVRMDTSTGKASSSQYLTFRTVTLKQVGKWILPAQDKWNITQQVYDKTINKIREFVTAGVKKDIGLEQ